MRLDLEPPYLVIKPGVTEADFYGAAGEDSDWEFLGGKLIMHSPASYQHEDLFRFLLMVLSGFLEERGGAIVLGSRFPMRLDENWSPEPDLLVVGSERRSLVTKQRLEGPADMVIEIVSESDAGLVYHDKLPRYREAGIPEIWIVDPFRRTLTVDIEGPEGRDQRVHSSGRLHSLAVPGFWILADWLWQPQLPPALKCLREILGGNPA